MNSRSALALMTLVGLAPLASPGLVPPVSAAPRQAVMLAPQELKWKATPDGTPAVLVSPLWGDPAKGAYGAFMRIPAGAKQGLSFRSLEVKGIVISGTFVYRPDVGPERHLQSGSYFLIPAGTRHATECKAGGACILFLEQLGRMDIKPAPLLPPKKSGPPSAGRASPSKPTP